MQTRRAQLVAIWPDARARPANMLRFYVAFERAAEAALDRSSPKLLNDVEMEVASPFLVFAHELWNPDG